MLSTSVASVLISERVTDMRKWENLDALGCDPDKVGGVWVFRGTRVPVSALFENLRDGASLEQFLARFPGVKRSQVESVLNFEAKLAGAVQSPAVRTPLQIRVRLAVIAPRLS